MNRWVLEVRTAPNQQAAFGTALPDVVPVDYSAPGSEMIDYFGGTPAYLVCDTEGPLKPLQEWALANWDVAHISLEFRAQPAFRNA